MATADSNGPSPPAPSIRSRRQARLGALAVAVVVVVVVGSALLVLGDDGGDDGSGGISRPERRPQGRAEGYGQQAAGGDGGGTVAVTSTADDGPGSLRAALSGQGPRIVRFALSGRIDLDDPVSVPSDTTIDGRGTDVTISGRGLVLSDAHSVVIHDLTFAGGEGDTTDAVQVTDASSDIWIDHCDFSDYGDGLVDITRGATDVTISWSRFTDHDKVILVNNEDDPGTPVRVTLHHNLFDGTRQRHPLVRFATTHAYNNVLRGWEEYGMKAERDGQILSEANVYEAGESDRALTIEGDFGRGAVRSEGDLALDGAVLQENEPGSVFDPTRDYRADVQPADSSLRRAVDSSVGVRSNG